MAEDELNIRVTDRKSSPFRQPFNGQLVGFNEGQIEKAELEKQVKTFEEREDLLDQMEDREAEI